MNGRSQSGRLFWALCPTLPIYQDGRFSKGILSRRST